MRERNWDIGYLYNQKSNEHSQLFFSHMFKTATVRACVRGPATTRSLTRDITRAAVGPGTGVIGGARVPPSG
jgi:hypothetical protein